VAFLTLSGLAQQQTTVSTEKLPPAPSEFLASPSHADFKDWKRDGNTSSSLMQSNAALASIRIASNVPAKERVADKKFILMNGLALGMAVFDVEMTQSCIASHHCRETNPLMASSQAGQLGLNLGLVSGATLLSYHQKKNGSKTWWLPPVMGSVVHSFGVTTGLQHR
jgi:hypothetical protein